MEPLSRLFFEKHPEEVAQNLLGCTLVRITSTGEILTGIISEVEAYRGESDPAAHAFRGKTKRTAVLFEEAGLAYIHTIHRQFCMDVTCEEVGRAGSVLLRGVIPLEGIERMRKNRGKVDTPIQLLTNGPGKLTQAFEIDKNFYGADLTEKNSSLFITKREIDHFSTQKTKRIGISRAKDELLRFVLKFDKSHL